MSAIDQGWLPLRLSIDARTMRAVPLWGAIRPLVSVRPPDPVANAHLTVDDFQNLALAGRGTNLS